LAAAFVAISAFVFQTAAQAQVGGVLGGVDKAVQGAGKTVGDATSGVGVPAIGPNVGAAVGPTVGGAVPGVGPNVGAAVGNTLNGTVGNTLNGTVGNTL